MKPSNYDFAGYVTRANVRCQDGRTIRHGAFSNDSGKVVPLVWHHAHKDLSNILGNIYLEEKNDGMYGYGTFNGSANGQLAKEYVQHGDITKMSIFADELDENQATGVVSHGCIKEVSLVYAGANPGAYIDNVIMHGEVDPESAVVYCGDDASIMEIQNGIIFHASDEKKKKEDEEDETSGDDDGKKTVFNGGKTVAEVIDSMTDEQKAVAFGLAEQMMLGEDDEDDDEEGGNKKMKHNAFDGTYAGDVEDTSGILTHELQEEIIADAKRYGSMKEACIQHAAGDVTYGIENVDYLFPEAKMDSPIPTFYSRNMDWVKDVMNGVTKSPFSRVKSMFADITADEARAKGYVKGKKKIEEVFTLLKRTTTPTTVYKKQKMDRDDVIDITDFDVIAWIKGEMRTMLDEELARAFIVGDGRLSSSDDKINEQNIRPILTDDDFYTIKTYYVASSTASYKDKADAIVEAVLRARLDYRGSGNPIALVSDEFVTTMLLAQDVNGRYIYESEEAIARKLRVSRLIPVPVIDGVKGKNGGDLRAVIVNLRDYRVGADKGGSVNMFDDFDIDYNQQKYLIETRCSGALTVPKSAIVVEELASAPTTGGSGT